MKKNEFLQVPDKFGIPITEKCHLRCFFCANNSLFFKEGRHLSLLDFKKIVDWLTSQGVRKLDLTPVVGEPLLVPHLSEMLDYLEQNPLIEEYDLFTSLIAKKIHPLYLRKKMKLFISLYGFNQKQFLKTARVDAFHVFLKNMKSLLLNRLEKKVVLIQRCPMSDDIDRAVRVYIKMTDIFYFETDSAVNRDNRDAIVGQYRPEPCRFMYEPVVGINGLSLCCKDTRKNLKIADVGDDLSLVYKNLMNLIESKGLACNKTCGWFKELEIDR